MYAPVPAPFAGSRTGFLRALSRAAMGPETSLPALLRRLIGELGWEAYAVWAFGTDANRLQCVSSWARRSERSVPWLGRELVGRAWTGRVQTAPAGEGGGAALIAVPVALAGMPAAVFVFATTVGHVVGADLRACLEEAGGGPLAFLYATCRHTLRAAVLTDREIQVLQCAADGSGVDGIGAALGIAPSTVKTHLEHVYVKLDVSDRASAVAQGFRRELIA